MKKIIITLLALFLCSSCTEQIRVRRIGGNTVINVEPGYKIVEATWKDGSNLWYLIEPMDDEYIPKTKIFKESSAWGVVEGR